MKIQSAKYVRSAHSRDDFPRDGLPEVAFVGRSNVGKSSLLNRLIGRKQLARISSSPGRTRAINYFLINDRFYFVDLPGYGYAKVSKNERRRWAQLIEAYFEQALPSAHVIQLVDAKVGATESDQQSYEYLKHLGANVTVVATKIDRVPRSRRAASLAEIKNSLDVTEGTRIVPFSAKTGEGIQQLWSSLPLGAAAAST